MYYVRVPCAIVPRTACQWRKRPGTLVRIRASDASGTDGLKMHTYGTASAQNVGRRAADTRPTWRGLRTGRRVVAGHGFGRVHRGGRVWDGAPAGLPTVVPYPVGGRMNSSATKAQRSARALISSRIAAYQDARRRPLVFKNRIAQRPYTFLPESCRLRHMRP